MTGPAAGPSPAKQPHHFRRPDIPEKDPDDMTSSKHLARNGNMYRLAQHLGNPEKIVVSGERYICAEPGSLIRYPDLLVAFDADPELYEANNGYVVSLQGKPPDLVLEIASRATGHIDTQLKPDFYAVLGIAEYWRFDETGEFHGQRLGGDRLVDGEYQPIPIETRGDGGLRGYSRVLDLYFCWDNGLLELRDPKTASPIASMDSLREEIRELTATAELERQLRESAQARAELERQIGESAQARAEDERQLRETAEARAEQERQLRETAEARVRELEERLRQSRP